MTEENSAPPKPPSAHRPSQRALRASLLLPIVITAVIWGVGLLLYLVTPGEFNTAVAIAVSLGLLVFLLYWTRNANSRLRLTAVVLAIPALIGISLGMINGRTSLILLGLGGAFALLVVYRLLNTPISYRFAYRQFRNGNLDQALNLVDKAIQARPDFWESYQLRALIFLAKMDFSRAERSAKESLRRKPEAHFVYNTLGQIYLVQNQFEKAQAAYLEALRLEPGNALYRYHLGLCLFRQEDYGEAAESLIDALKSSLRFLEYELWAHYYLWRSLRELGEAEQAQTVHEQMQQFAGGVPRLQAQIQEQPDTPHLALMQADLEDLAQQVTADS